MRENFRKGFVVLVTLSTLFACSTFSLLTSDPRPEKLREWKRTTRSNDKLILFVHGFNSSRDGAWESFPDLILRDSYFQDYNVHLFGYPTKVCKQTTNVRDQGEYLASFLRDIIPQYKSIILVGHSMGGLVILYALLDLEKKSFLLIKNADLKVMTFGTPYRGVEDTELLLLLCDNKQVHELKNLSDALFHLEEDWRQRFNQTIRESGRDTPQVSLYAYRGINDNFVRQASACGSYVTLCETVDGDHFSIVKPLDMDHSAYAKLKGVAGLPPLAADRQRHPPPAVSLPENQSIQKQATANRLGTEKTNTFTELITQLRAQGGIPLLHGVRVKLVHDGSISHAERMSDQLLIEAGAFVDKEQRLPQQLPRKVTIEYANQRLRQAEVIGQLLLANVASVELQPLQTVGHYDVEVYMPAAISGE